MDMKIPRKPVDAKGETILIKFFEGTWCCVGPFRKSSRHLSKRSALEHVELVWKNYMLKTIDHNGVLETEDCRTQKPVVKNSQVIMVKEAWARPPIPPPEQESEPAWLPIGRVRW